jgi:cation diffusion facilitator family transporter
MAHRHTTGNRSRAEKVAGAALALTGVLAALKFAAWAATGSLAILSQALDSLVDIIALALVFLAVRIAGKPADAQHHYGHAKAENLAAFTQTLLLGVLLTGVVVEALGRLMRPASQIEVGGLAIVLMAVSAAVDILRVRFMTAAGRTERSEALRAGALNLAGDVGTALVALASLILVRAGIESADALGAIVVAVVVAVAGWRLGKRSVDVLMDRAPGAPVHAIEAAASAASGVAETRRVRVRGNEGRVFADVTVAAGRTTSLERAHDIASSVEREIERAVPGADVVVHVEPTSETSELVERAQAAASRAQGVREVHNVSVHSLQEERGTELRVSLHAKVPPGLSVGEAHELSDAIEARVAQELGANVRVDTHLEPLSPTSVARDVTAERPDVVELTREVATAEPDVVDCHEVLVTETGSRLSVVAHVHGRFDLVLDALHSASERIEKAIQVRAPEIAAVLLHFEPLEPEGTSGS